MKKFIFVIGTRPEAIKLCPVISELRRHSAVEVKVCSTGQHRQMLQQVFSTFEVDTDFDLSLMTAAQSLAQVTAQATAGLDKIFSAYLPEVVVVQGDTTSAMAGALVAYYHRLTVAHVEAGLRTGNKFAPFPEEINRRFIGQLADLHFAPTPAAAETLIQEGIQPSAVHITGNTVIDALFWVREKVIQQVPLETQELCECLGQHPIVLITGHRRESLGAKLEGICQAIRRVADQFPAYHFVYPVHLNPQVQEPVQRLLGNHSRIHLIEPLSYEPFVWLLNRSTVVLTDSGGIQEEAPALGKPVLVIRETTERPEGIVAGNAKLVGTNPENIVRELSLLLSDDQERLRMTAVNNPYGDGMASGKITQILLT